MNIKLEKQKICKAQRILELIEKFEERIDSMQGWIEHGIFPVTNRDLKNLQFAKQSKTRLENYYNKLIFNNI